MLPVVCWQWQCGCLLSAVLCCCEMNDADSLVPYTAHPNSINLTSHISSQSQHTPPISSHHISVLVNRCHLLSLSLSLTLFCHLFSLLHSMLRTHSSQLLHAAT